MPEPDDMERPVTRRELREELANYATKAELRDELARFKAEMRDEFATKVELQNMTKLLLREMNTMFTTLRGDIATMRSDITTMRSDITTMRSDITTMRSDMAAMRDELHGDLARHARAIEEATRAQIAALDDKYADLPGRVAALEAERERG